MELRQIEYVVAVLEHGGFTRAANALHVAQPTLSQGVRSLERELGVALFHRLGRRVALTSAGEAFLGPARQLLRDQRVLLDSVAAVAGLRAGRLDLVALPTLAVDPLADLLGAFRAAYPQISVRLVEPEDAQDVIALVRDGTCELGLADAHGQHDLVSHHLLEQDMLAVCPPGTPLVPGGTLDAGQLAAMALVTTPPGTSTRRLVDEALASASVRAHVAVETGQREAILPLVLAGAGTSILPRPLALQAAGAGAVIATLDPPLRRDIALVHRDGPLSPVAATFVALTLTRRGE